MKLDIIFPLEYKAETCADGLIEFMEQKGWSVRRFFVRREVLLDNTFNTCDWADLDAELVLTVDSPYSIYAIKSAFIQAGKLCQVVSWIGACGGEICAIQEYGDYLYFADAHFTSDSHTHEELRRLLPESHIFDIDLTFSRKTDYTESDCTEKIFNTDTVGSDAIQSTYKTDGAGAKGISLEVGSRLWRGFAELECKLRAIATEPDTMFQMKEYGRLYVKDKISIIIPCYNVAKYIKTCIQSLLASTLPLPMLEFIFVDNVSTDDTKQIIKQYEAVYPDNIILVECEENGGPGTARNIGMQYASGDYIGFVDGDDFIKPDMIQKLYEAVALYQCDYSRCGFYYEDDDGKLITIWNRYRAFYDMEDDKTKEEYISNPEFPSVCKLMLRKSFIDEHMITFPGYLHAEDAYFYNVVTFCAKRIISVGEPLYVYRHRAGSLMNSDGFNERYKHEYVVAELIYETLKEKNLIDKNEELVGLIYYLLACEGIVEKMLTHSHGIEIDADMIRLVRSKLFCRFPNARTNRFILNRHKNMCDTIRKLMFLEDASFEQMMIKLTVSEHEPQAK